MCIIIVKPEGVALAKANLEYMWDSNPHGAGFMFTQDNELHVHKGIMQFDELVRKMKKAGSTRKMVIHLRWRTHGSSDANMTHPFWIHKGRLAMAHNGVIQAVANQTTPELSDTCIFAKKIAKAYTDPLVAVQHPFHRELIESYVGSSRLAFMDNTGKTYIINEHRGEWHKDVWYSNTYYRTTREESQQSSFLANYESWLSLKEKSRAAKSDKSDGKVEVKNAPVMRWEQRGNQIVQVKRYPVGASGKKG